jgi:hypothetical protein
VSVSGVGVNLTDEMEERAFRSMCILVYKNQAVFGRFINEALTRQMKGRPGPKTWGKRQLTLRIADQLKTKMIQIATEELLLNHNK